MMLLLFVLRLSADADIAATSYAAFDILFSPPRRFDAY